MLRTTNREPRTTNHEPRTTNHEPRTTNRKRNRISSLACCVVSTMGLSAGICSASELVNLSVEIDGWTMMAISDGGATTHIIATRDDDEALLTDIDVVLYERTLTGWSGTAYDPHITKEDAMIDLADEFELVDLFDPSDENHWVIDLKEENVLDYILPREGFGKGFFVSDPLYEIANHLNDPEPLAEAAEGAGLAAGGSKINTGSPIGGGGIGPEPGGDGCGCTGGCLQAAIAAGADVYIALNPTTQEEADAALDGADLAFEDSAQALLLCCVRRTTSTITSGPWSCGPWLSSPPVSIPLTQGLYDCTYTRTTARTQRKTSIRRCADCTRCTWTETRTQRGEQSHTEQLIVFPGETPSCPNPPSQAPACTGVPTNSGPWQSGSGTPCCWF